MFGSGFSEANFGGFSGGAGSDAAGAGGRGGQASDGDARLRYIAAQAAAPLPQQPAVAAPAPFADLMLDGIRKAQERALVARQGGAPQMDAMPMGGILAPQQPQQMGGILGGAAQGGGPYTSLIAQLSDYRTR